MPKKRIGGRVRYFPTAIFIANGWTLPASATGVTTAQQDTTNDKDEPWADATDVEMQILRRSMGQTGNEAGMNRRWKGDSQATYVQTSKSYLVNNFLRGGNVRVGNLDDGAKHWLLMGYTNADALQTVRSIDAGMKPLTKDLKVERYEGKEYVLKDYLGENAPSFDKVKNMTQAQLNNLLLGKSRGSETYLSTSWRMDNSQRDMRYKQRPVKVEYTLKKGVDAVVTNNINEHEVLVGRGYHDEIKSVKFRNGQLVIRVEIDPTMRKMKAV